MDTTSINPVHSRQHRATSPLSDAPAGVTKYYLAECESLRGIAILLVILFHSYLELSSQYPLQPNFFNAFIISGNTGVTLFFVLSGFLLNLPFLRNNNPQANSFFKKRALRILPMYVLMVIIGGIYNKDIAAVLRALFFWNVDIRTLWPFGSVWWSLMVEVQFYLLLPCLYQLARSPRLHRLIYPTFFAGCFVYLLFTGRLPWKPTHFYFIADPKSSILCLWPAFFCGGLLAWTHNKYAATIKAYFSSSRFFSGGGADLLFYVIVFILAAELFNVAHFGPMIAYLDHYDHFTIDAALWALIIAGILYLPLKTKWIVVNPLFTGFGVISYSLYLLHFPVLFFGLRFFSNHQCSMLCSSKLMSTAILLGLAVGLSILTYNLVEKPILNLKSKLIR